MALTLLAVLGLVAMIILKVLRVGDKSSTPTVRLLRNHSLRMQLCRFTNFDSARTQWDADADSARFVRYRQHLFRPRQRAGDSYYTAPPGVADTCSGAGCKAGTYGLRSLVASTPGTPSLSLFVIACWRRHVVKNHSLRRACAQPSAARGPPAPLAAAAQQTPAVATHYRLVYRNHTHSSTEAPGPLCD